MISSQKIIDIMGLSCKVESLYELNSQGLPKNCLKHTVKHLSSDISIQKNIQNRLISSAKFKSLSLVLNTDESERVARIARIYAETLDVWGNKEDAQLFLFYPHPLFNNKTPIDMPFTSVCAEIVEQLINKIR